MNLTRRELFTVFLRLGCRSFGGPVAHLGYYREELVERRRWLSEGEYVDLVALTQFLPGPSSSQVGMGIGFARAGLGGGIAAFAGFALPSALIMIALGLGVAAIDVTTGSARGVLHALGLVAVAVVAKAVFGMAMKFCTDVKRVVIAALGAAIVLGLRSVAGGSGTILSLTPVAAIVVGAVLGTLLLRQEVGGPVASSPLSGRLDAATARRCAILFVALFALLPVAAVVFDHARPVEAAHRFFRTGSLVFGGGHVVLPLLESSVVSPGWVDQSEFLAGYGAAQALPGPLFTIAGYLGTFVGPSFIGGVLGIVAIFLPGFLLLAAALPFWDRLRSHAPARAALDGVKAAVVGLLFASWIAPVVVSTVESISDALGAAVILGVLAGLRLAPWIVVIGAAIVGLIAA